MEEKKSLNWDVPAPIAEAFDAYVTEKWGPKRKWAGAASAILMFLGATDKERSEYEMLTTALMMSGQTEDVLESVLKYRKRRQEEQNKPRIAARSSPPSGGKPAPPKR